MGATSGIGGGAVGPWYRVQAMTADGRRGNTAERDYACVLPAVLNAALHRRPFVAGWLSRGGGAPLELITNAGPGQVIGPGRAIAIGAGGSTAPGAAVAPGEVIEPGGPREHVRPDEPSGA